MRMIRVAMQGLDAQSLAAALAEVNIVERALRNGVSPTATVRPWVLASYEKREDATDFGIRFLCRDGDLDHVVAHHRVPGLHVAEEAESFGGRKVVQYLYRCADIRGRGAMPAK